MPRGVEKVPQVMQMEALECGDACLAMILAYYGRWETLEKVREQCGVSRATVGFYTQRMVGDLQQRQSSNESITFALIGQIAPIIVNVIMLLLYLFVMLRYSVLLTAVGVATVIINTFLARFVSMKRVNVSRSATANAGKKYSTGVSGIEMIETIKAAGAENSFFERWSGYQALMNKDMVRTTRCRNCG